MNRYFLLVLSIFILSFCSVSETKLTENNMMENIRQPAVAGQFYPDDPEKLEFKIKGYLEAASNKPSGGEIKAIIVPHAGYDFSAPVAAEAYKRIEGKSYARVIIICNSHTAYFDGLAVDDSDAWQTPLGEVEADREFTDKLVKADNIIKYNNEAHKSEHALEVQLPFLQVALTNDFKIAPILFGNTEDESYVKLAEILTANLGDNDLVVISTDMSHYPSYANANNIDKRTLDLIIGGDIEKLTEHILNTGKKNIYNEQTLLCGIDGVKTIMALREKLNWLEPEILKYANSGDAASGDKKSVVGYGTIIYKTAKNKQPAAAKEEKKLLNRRQQKELLKIARTSVENYISEEKIADFNITDERLNRPEGAFVTLSVNGKLRGCIGRILSEDEPLWQIVRDMAMVAATEDNRFLPVSQEELKNLKYEISVLSQPEIINNWQEIELGKHGVIVEKGNSSGVFLPQVADETGWSKEEFLSQLCAQKVGLPADCYKADNIKLSVFTAQVFKD